MLVYEKIVEEERHLFGTMANVPGDDDVQLTYKDENGATASPTLEDKFFDDGQGGIKMVHDDDGTAIESELNVFIGDVNIIPGDFEAPEFTITVAATENGTAAVDPVKGKFGTEITITATPADTYQVDQMSAKDADDNAVTITNNKFTMPASNVTVTVTFKVAG